MTDSKTTQPPAEELFDQNLADMIHGMATGYFRKYGKNSSSIMIRTDDLETEGYLGATVAYQTFDYRQGATNNHIQSFRTYAFPYIKAAMNAYCRRYSHVLSISERDSRDNMNSINSIQVVRIDQPQKDADYFDIPVGSGMELPQEVSEHLFAGLSALEVKLIKGHILEDHSLQELADEHGLSKSRTGEIVRAAKNKMKERVVDYV